MRVLTQLPQHDLGQVPARPSLNSDRGAEEPDVLRSHAAVESEEGLARFHAQSDLFVDLPEFLSNRVRHLLADEPDRATQGVSCPDGASDHIQGVRELDLEARKAAVPLVDQVDNRRGSQDERGEDPPGEHAGPEPPSCATDGSAGRQDQHEIAAGRLVACR